MGCEWWSIISSDVGYARLERVHESYLALRKIVFECLTSPGSPSVEKGGLDTESTVINQNNWVTSSAQIMRRTK